MKNQKLDQGVEKIDGADVTPKKDLRLVKQTLKNLSVRSGVRAGCMKEDCPGTCH